MGDDGRLDRKTMNYSRKERKLRCFNWWTINIGWTNTQTEKLSYCTGNPAFNCYCHIKDFLETIFWGALFCAFWSIRIWEICLFTLFLGVFIFSLVSGTPFIERQPFLGNNLFCRQNRPCSLVPGKHQSCWDKESWEEQLQSFSLHYNALQPDSSAGIGGNKFNRIQ